MNTSTPSLRSPLLLFLVIVCAAFALRTEPVLAQAPEPALDDDASGTYYVIAFPDTASNYLDLRFPNTRVRGEAAVWIYSAVKNRVKITSSGGASTVLTLEPAKFKIHNITGMSVVDVINGPINRTFKIESDYPVIIYCYFATTQGVEAWAPIPVEFWGTTYYAATIPGEVIQHIGAVGEVVVPSTPGPAPGNILIVAAHDNTQVTLQPTPGIQFVGDPPLSFTMHEGQAFQVQSRVDTTKSAGRQEDLGGTIIQASRPIGVISGNTRTQVLHDDVGIKNNVYKNMLAEWLAPTDQHGKEFVFMPTYDDHRPGIGSTAERQREFARLYNTSGRKLKGYHLTPGGNGRVVLDVRKDTLAELAFSAPVPVYFKTEEPAQMIMHSTAIVKDNGSTPCFNGIPCLSYSAWAPYMVELTPREQWATFAPYYAPGNPGSMLHYINVVTDTFSAQKIYREDGTRVLLNRVIPGTDLVWGSMAVVPGQDHWLIGSDGARFGGFVYGLMAGAEEYRPGRSRKKGDHHAIAGGGGAEPQPQRPAEYEEINAVSYGYPLAPTRRVLTGSDTLAIDSVLDCAELRVRIRAVNARPVGLRSVTLEPASIKNAKLEAVDPQRLSDIPGRSMVEVKIKPINDRANASATLIIRDRSGKVWTVYYKYEAEYVDVAPQPLVDYGKVAPGRSKDTVITITNPLARPIEVREITLAIKTQGYTIEEVTPAVPATLVPGATMTVRVSSTPVTNAQLYADTLKVQLGCTRSVLPLISELALPRIHVDDIDFGDFSGVGDPPKTLPLRICNEGDAPLAFANPNAGGKLVEWDDPGFTIDSAALAGLHTKTLVPGECIELPVTFTPGADGSVRTVARVWGITRTRRDTSIWTAMVGNVLSVSTDANEEGYHLAVGGAQGSGEIRFTLPKREHVRLAVFNTAGELVSALADGAMEPGAHTVRWNSADAPAGIYYCRVVAGAWSRTVPVVVMR